MTTTATRIEQILDTLNSYEGDNIWQDVVYGLDEYDQDATDAADRSYSSDVIVLVDGQRIEFAGGRWVA